MSSEISIITADLSNLTVAGDTVQVAVDISGQNVANYRFNQFEDSGTNLEALDYVAKTLAQQIDRNSDIRADYLLSSVFNETNRTDASATGLIISGEGINSSSEVTITATYSNGSQTTINGQMSIYESFEHYALQQYVALSNEPTSSAVQVLDFSQIEYADLPGITAIKVNGSEIKSWWTEPVSEYADGFDLNNYVAKSIAGHIYTWSDAYQAYIGGDQTGRGAEYVLTGATNSKKPYFVKLVAEDGQSFEVTLEYRTYADNYARSQSAYNTHASIEIYGPIFGGDDNYAPILKTPSDLVTIEDTQIFFRLLGLPVHGV